MSDFRVLDANLAALLTRCYIAVRPRESFREQLERDVLARVVRLRDPQSVPRWKRTWVPIAAAAAVLVGALAWGWYLANAAKPGEPERGNDVVQGEPSAPASAGIGALDRVSHDGSGSDAARDDERRGVDLPQPQALAAAPEVKTPLLAGSVTRASDGAPLDDFRITFLPILQLPQVAQPVTQEFHAAHGRFAIDEALLARSRREGTVYRVEVQSSGYAAYRVDRFEPTPGATQSLAAVLDGGWTVRGLVVDDATGLPIADAWVVSESDTPLQVLGIDPNENELPSVIVGTRTGADGGFELAHLRSGPQLLRASAPGYGPAWSAPITAGAGETSDKIELRLAAAARIEGSILDEHGQPGVNMVLIASATNLTRPCVSFDFALSDAQGEFELHDLSGGDWVVLKMIPAATGALSPELKFARLESGGLTRVDFHAVLARQVLRGTVRDTAGKPIVGLTLMIAPADRADAPPPEGIWFSTVTDAQGEYELQDLEPGPYEACVSVATAQDIVHVGSFEVPPGSAAEHHFVLARAAIRGTVINAQTRAPLEQSVVLLLRQTASGEEFAGRVLGDVHGRFAFVHVTPGVYSVFAYALRGELGQECVERLTLGDGEVLEGLVFELGPGATLELSAVDDAGAPVAGALVKFHDASGREVSFSDVEVTDERGDYEARGMKPGRWTLTLTAAGFERAERTLELAAGERPQLRVELRRTR